MSNKNSKPEEDVDDNGSVTSTSVSSDNPEADPSKDAETISKLSDERDRAWSEVTKLRGEVSHRVDEYKQLRARHERESQDLRENLVGDVASEFFSVIDDVERMLESARESESESLSRGTEIVLNHFEKALSNLGIHKIGEAGEAFDPAIHEGVHTEIGDVGEPTVAGVVRVGYRTSNRVLRAAMVSLIVPRP